MKAMLLAAGLGTRLLPLTLSRAKAAVPYRGRPLICHCLEALAAAGVEDVAINLHHLPDTVRAAVASGNANRTRVHYSHESRVLGTAGALNPVRAWLQEQPLLLINGKIVFDFGLRDALARHRQSGALATLVLVDRIAGEDFNPVFIDSEERVTGFAATPEERALPGFVFTGIHFLNPRIFEYVPTSGFADMVRDVYRPALLAGECIRAERVSGNWLEFSTLRRYLRLNLEAREPLIGQDSEIAATARLFDTVVWNRARIADGCELRNCVVADEVDLPEGTRISNAIIVPARLATPEFVPYVRDGSVVFPLEQAR